MAAAVLGGATRKGVLGRLHALPTHERPHHERTLEEVRVALGDDAYQAASDRGATMGYDELITLALAHIDRAAVAAAT